MTARGTDAREHSVVRASLLLDTTASWSSKKLTAVVVLMIASVALVACGQRAGALDPPTVSKKTPASESTPRGSRPGHSSTTRTTIPPVTALTVTPIDWSSCGEDEQCGYLKVPLDYAHPRGATIEMAVERHLAELPSERIGSLVIDPGGPGGSGLDDMTNELDSLTPGLLDYFDIVVFDPRGVQRSDAFTCGESSESSSANSSRPGPDPVPDNAATTAQLDAEMKQYAAACEKASGSTLPYLGTVNVARDLERLRIALGDAKLTYMGQSYGTLIGELYAQMFPTHVRAMVLDSTIDPGLGTNQMTLDQAEGFEADLEDFFSWCASSSCPWHPSGSPTAALLALIRAAYTTKPPPGRAYAGAADMYDAILDGLYSSEEWPRLADALAADQAGDDNRVLSMSTGYNTSNSTNADDLFNAVNCLDHPVSRNLASYPHLAAVDGAMAPVFGPLFAWGEAQCAVWPAPPTRVPEAVIAPGAPPIVVIGSTGDPATPYSWAKSVAQEFTHSVLITFRGDDHVAYFYSECVRNAVQSYLIEKLPPRPGLVCT
jgi:pimeloyl-ACP methyl ester carboxylesterase